MRRRWKLTLVALLSPIVVVVIAFRILESPSRILRHSLHLQQLPASIENLRMGSDIWTDEVRDFYFEIAANDFPTLLTGRKFRRIDPGGPVEARTLHISPSISFTARCWYVWEVEGAHCLIQTTEEKTRVMVVFGAD